MGYVKSLLLFICLFTGLSVNAHNQVVTPALQERLSRAEPDELIRVNIRMSEQYDSKVLYDKASRVSTRKERRELVAKELKVFSETHQKDLLSFLDHQEKSMQVSQVKPLWIVNLVNCYATVVVIRQLEEFPGVERVDYDKVQQILDTGWETSPIMSADKLTPPEIAWNINLIGAPQVWEDGYTGEGIVVAVLDTGVNAGHADLTGRMWEHPEFVNHGYNFVEDNHNTHDYHGHGTHCAGTVAGNGAAGTITGVAPEATIMALKVLSNQGSGTEAGVWEAIGFSIEHGADIMSLSLGWPHGAEPDRAAWRIAMVNAMNAGVIASVAAGNEGNGGMGTQPPPNNIRTPGDCPAPWTHPDQIAEGGNSAVVTVGATTSADDVAGFSSKGPVTWQNVNPFNDYPLTQGLFVPDVVAPGHEILSLVHNSNSGYTVKSGTSMAAPAVAGLMALMLSKNPLLTPEEISQILEETAVPLHEGKNNVSGSGRIDAQAALEAVWGSIVYINHTVNDSEGNDDGLVNPGETIHLSVELSNSANGPVSNVSAMLLSDSPYVTILQGNAELGDFGENETLEFEDIFTVKIAENIPGHYEMLFTLNVFADGDTVNVWKNSFTETAWAPLLAFQAIIVDDTTYGNENGLLEPGETATLRVALKNSGQIASEPVTMKVESDSEWIIFHHPEPFDGLGIEPDSLQKAEFMVTAVHSTPLASLAEMLLTAVSGHYQVEDLQTLRIGEIPVYSQGNIPSTLNQNPTISSQAVNPGQLTVSIPHNATITSVDLEYRIVSTSGAWVRDQRSFLKCLSDGGDAESAISSGPLNNVGGAVDYSRTELPLANNVQGGGDIEFELHVFRTWGGSGSGTQYAYVPNNSWKIVVHYQLPQHEVTFQVSNQTESWVESARIDVYGETGYTNQSGEAGFMLPAGGHFYSVAADRHTGFDMIPLQVSQDGMVEVMLQRYFWATFTIKNQDGENVADASLVVAGDSIEGMEAEWLENGIYDFSVSALGYHPYDGAFVIDNSDLQVEVFLTDESLNYDDPGENVFVVYPNPVSEMLSVDFTAAEGATIRFALYDELGRLIISQSIAGNNRNERLLLDVGSLTSGVYVLTIDDGMQLLQKKVIVQ
ncbi:MAG: T9SS C-terminal target domain-containing protein [Bacteroidetes bacterium]|nr:MAG: T9SS C-terminal target domain-containing protein [Bacteroidota bacterium]